MLIGGKKVGVLKELSIYEMTTIIKNLPETMSYSYKCVYKSKVKAERDKFNLYIFKNKN